MVMGGSFWNLSRNPLSYSLKADGNLRETLRNPDGVGTLRGDLIFFPLRPEWISLPSSSRLINSALTVSHPHPPTFLSPLSLPYNGREERGMGRRRVGAIFAP